jgi:hypothetical protein
MGSYLKAEVIGSPDAALGDARIPQVDFIKNGSLQQEKKVVVISPGFMANGERG